MAKSAISVSRFPATMSSLEEVLPEFVIGDKIADFVLVGKEYDRRAMFLVVEIKQRPLTTFGVSYSNATKQALVYAKKLQSRFFAVYDGWLIFVFQPTYPYLLGIYNAELEKELTQSALADLFVGLMEFKYANKRERLGRLPRPRDPELVKQRILPTLARTFAKQMLQDEGSKELDRTSVDKRSNVLIDSWIKSLRL